VLSTHVPFDTSHWREASASVQALLRRMLLLLPLLSGLADRHEALEGRKGATDEWSRLLRESHAVRAKQTGDILDECEALMAHLDDPELPAPLSAEERRQGIKTHADTAFALLSGGAASIAILICCTIWIGTGWADGGVAAMMTGLFCCLFAALDNPVPMILRFGGALLAGVPVAGLYLFVLLPPIDSFVPLALLLLPPLLLAGYVAAHPRWGIIGLAAMMGFTSALALQESLHADFEHFLNTNLAQVLGVLIAAGVTAGLRTIGTDAAIGRLNVRLRRDLVRIANATTPPDRFASLSRTTDRLALITQRLGDATDDATSSLREVRLALNLVALQDLRQRVDRKLGLALQLVLHDVARWFAGSSDGPLPERLLLRIDNALRLMLADPPQWERLPDELLDGTPAEGLAALVALRRNLYPDAPGFVAGRKA
jgi:uncharacterized membrane protein YccC